MKKIIATILLAFFLSCSTTNSYYQDEQSFKPDATIGCAKYTGVQWDRCIIKLLRKMESLGEYEPKKEELDKYRISEVEVIVKVRRTYGDDFFHTINYEKRYEPTIWYQIENSRITKVVILGIGIFIGGL